MRIGEESLPPRFGISDLPPDSGDVTLDTCDDVIPYFVMDRKEGPRKQKNPKRGTCRARIAQTGRKGGWSASGEPGGGSASPESGSRALTRRRVDGFLVPVLWDKLEISSRRSLRCRKKKPSPEKFAGKIRRKRTDGRNEREREMIGLRYGQKDLAGMSDGLNKRESKVQVPCLANKWFYGKGPCVHGSSCSHSWYLGVKIFVIAAFFAFTLASIALCTRIEPGLEQQIVLPRDSYLQGYFNNVSEYLRIGPPLYFVVKDYNYRYP
ncbi:hypothetical protein CK203_010508 [Vitis vinifera]|uniref:Uncharacterized protein n=1 Tax=Vitis vinifera TaxID=29760 RepID=A0A438JSY0_VITVI|nr:hypothetical protein CK203_010508 [Vitis vinifera]